MIFRITLKDVMHRASVHAGALLCLGVALLSVSCDESKGTPDWSSAPATEETATGHSRDVAVAGEQKAPGLSFMSYNIENWLTMERGGGSSKEAPKPESEKRMVVQLILSAHPDVLGVQEIGTETDLKDLQRRLKAGGWEMPNLYHTGGGDPVRHLGLLSRYPVVSTVKARETKYRMQGREYRINRGILDATVAVAGIDYRFIGVHLKSKREVAGYDQAQMRVHEAGLLREHLDGIFKQDRKARLIVFGDFNDTRGSVAVRKVTGTRGRTGALWAIPLGDARGERWTHHWRSQDVYSRIDFVAVSQVMRREVDDKASRLLDDPQWHLASDHRPLLAVFKSH